MLEVELPDGSVREYSGSVRPIEMAAEIGPRLAKATLAAEVDGKVVGAAVPLPASGRVRLRLLTKKDPAGTGRDAAFGCAHHGPGGDAAVRGSAGWRLVRRSTRAFITTSICRTS